MSAPPPPGGDEHPFARLARAGSPEERTWIFETLRRHASGPLDLGGDAEHHARLAGTTAPKARLRRADLAFADLREADLSGAFLAQSRLQGAALERARLVRADLSHSDASRAAFSEADLSNALLEEADLSHAGFRFADMSGAALEGACLQGADLWSARLNDADFIGADLRGTVIREADAQRADFSGADLRGASLMNTSFIESVFVGTDLRDANVKGASFRGADMTRARLQGVDLTSCDLSGVRWALAHLDRTAFDLAQVMPAIGEELAHDHVAAASAYMALERNFGELGDVDAASWAYRRKRRMQKKALGDRAVRHWRDRRFAAAATDAAGYAGNLAVEWICDYGESVGRVFNSLIVTFLGFVLLYGLTGSVVRVDAGTRVDTSRLVDLALFSLASMTSNTASSGMLLPSHSYATFLAGAQATISLFLMGLLGFVAGNRIRR